MSIVHITEAEAARDFAGLLARVRAGDEVIIENGHAQPVVVRSAEQPKGRLLSESLRLAEEHARERGYDVVMDADFAADLEARIRDRKPRDTSAWD